MKQAKDFAKQNLGNTFKIDTGSKDKIVLNIGEEADTSGLIRLKKAKKPQYYKMTGNVIVDNYNKLNNWLLNNSNVPIKEKASFFNLLAVMLNAGLPLVKSLDTLAVQTQKNIRFSRIIYDLAREVEHGSTLSKAMRNYGDVFGASEIGIVEAGEISGQLNKVLDNIGDAAEKASDIRAKVKGALLYPAFILLLLAAVMIVMFVYVVPQIKGFFATTGNELPTMTKVVISISDFMVAYWQYLAMTVAGLVALFILWKKTDQGRKTVDGLKIRIPIFGKIIKKMLLARFARNFSNLLASGVVIISSLQIAAEAVGNEVYKERILMSAEDLKQGIPLGESFKDNPLFPVMLVNVIEVGEKTAQLDVVTEKIANFYDEDVSNTIRSISKVIEPVLLVTIGLSVGILVLAIMLPIIKVTDVASLGGF